MAKLFIGCVEMIQQEELRLIVESHVGFNFATETAENRTARTISLTNSGTKTFYIHQSFISGFDKTANDINKKAAELSL